MPMNSKNNKRIRLLSIVTTTALIMTAWVKILRSVPSSSAFSTTTTTRLASVRSFRSSAMQLEMGASPRSKTSPSIEYSKLTKDRIKGLDAATEFSKLAVKMNKKPDELKLVLAQRAAAITTMTAKEEYVDWLLSGAIAAGDEKQNPKKKRKAAAPAAKKTPISADTTTSNVMSSISKRTMRTLAVPSPSTTSEAQTFHTDIRFDDETKIDMHWNSRKAVAELGLTHMTEIQSKTFVAAAAGNDVLGRARTGTGKTVAFLLPAIERLVRDGSIDDPQSIGMLVVSPTRELATQIGEQAKQLLKHHQGTSVQVMFGGTNIKTDINRLSGRKGLPTILVATPGRLLDHLKTTKLKLNGNNLLSFGKHIMSETNVVVLDETDRLLDMGFRRDIERILDYLPSSRTRQTLLFSATMPPELKTIMKQNMKPNYVEVDCVQDGDAATHTNDAVAQSHIVLPSREIDMISSVVETVRYAVETHVNKEDDTSRFTIPPKIVVFFPTARLVQFYAQIFEEINKGVLLTESTGDDKNIKIPSWELHSKKSQGYRNRVSDEFRKATMGVLFTSDVSARGVDYPNVSHVIQFGMPENREQYIHRLGRTGRGGSKGKGWLVLQDWEASFLKELKGVDIPENNDLISKFLEEDIPRDSNSMVVEVQRRVRGGDGVLSKSASAAYAAFLGYYKSQMKRMGMRSPENLVSIANDFALSTGFAEPPQLQKSTVGKMGLKGVAGLNIGSGAFSGGGGGGRGGRGRGGGRGGRNGGRGDRSERGRGRSYSDEDGRRFR
uniref:ATP-dependent RNA helicase n=1 Tax=Pseudo-nitzschia australis TaxID=44445 RepID=A0A7S4AXN6_9STRA|mmetsp:Transcript_60/g.176  ORF Transcript_60/g.176 Transcript_60/m.176 type:complete len:779 (+) Transcript_60:148-2484(+)